MSGNTTTPKQPRSLTRVVQYPSTPERTCMNLSRLHARHNILYSTRGRNATATTQAARAGVAASGMLPVWRGQCAGATARVWLHAQKNCRGTGCVALSPTPTPLPHQPNTPPPPPCVCRAAHALRTAKPISRSGSPSMNPRHVQLVCDSQLDLAMIGGVHEPSGDILDGWRGQGAVVEEIGDGTHALLGCEVEVAQVHLAPLGVDIVLEVEFG